MAYFAIYCTAPACRTNSTVCAGAVCISSKSAQKSSRFSRFRLATHPFAIPVGAGLCARPNPRKPPLVLKGRWVACDPEGMEKPTIWDNIPSVSRCSTAPLATRGAFFSLPRDGDSRSPSVFACGESTCLAAARSRRGSDTTPWCHSTPRRRFATPGGRLTGGRGLPPLRCLLTYADPDAAHRPAGSIAGFRPTLRMTP